MASSAWSLRLKPFMLLCWILFWLSGVTSDKQQCGKDYISQKRVDLLKEYQDSLNSAEATTDPMTREEKLHLKEEAREMFYHGYNSYMDNAYPADELMPLGCKGRWRHLEPSRGDIDDVLGNFSLTLVDSLDTLVILGDLEEFERSLRRIIKDVSFDHDVIVSVFETNIRMVGGLLSGHILADHLNQLYGVLGWYRGELLSMALDLATRLLPAFNTTTGIPHARVNLKYGLKSPRLLSSKDTCTACAGTIILEFACLSRLSGNSIFEEKARIAMDYLWSQRHRGSDLMGTVLNIQTGDWIRRDSGVGAGIDSYYEYLFKGYILLGDEEYLERFNKHYNAVMKFVSHGPMLIDVHMHRPHTTSRNFMDALLAFWPGLQVMKGDIKPAIETHEMLYQIIQRHNFLPEAFTTDFQVHWGQHPLRPEFVESTYLLYEATGDHYYLRVGEKLLKSLQKFAWVPCGYAAFNDVRTGVHEDRMDSFVLAETFKYLYLLFTEPGDIPINLDEFVLTTEAHMFPLSLARLSNLTTEPVDENIVLPEEDKDIEYARSCPNAHYLFPGNNFYAENIRKQMKNFVSNICPSRKNVKRKLRAIEFQAGSPAHFTLLNDMGITIMTLKDGRVQLLHTASNAKSPEDAEEGLLFMQEMIELSKLQHDQPENPPKALSFMKPTKMKTGSSTNISTDNDTKDSEDATEQDSKGDANDTSSKENALVVIVGGPAQFGMQLDGSKFVSGLTVKADPIDGCKNIKNGYEFKDKIVVVQRGECMFVEKARQIESFGGVGGVVLDNSVGSTSANSAMFAMSGDGNDDVNIPMLFLFYEDSRVLLESMEEMGGNLMVSLSDYRDAVPVGSSMEHVIQIGGTKVPLEDIGTTGSIVKEALKKQQCVGDRAGADILSHQDGEDDLSIENALKKLEKSSTAEEVLHASANYVLAHLSSEKEDKELHLQSSSLLSDIQMLVLKKTANNPTLLRELLTKYLDKLSVIFKMASGNDNDMENVLHLLVGKLGSFSRGSGLLDDLDFARYQNYWKEIDDGDDDSIDFSTLNSMVKSDPEGSKTLLNDALRKSVNKLDKLVQSFTQMGGSGAEGAGKWAESLRKRLDRMRENFSRMKSVPSETASDEIGSSSVSHDNSEKLDNMDDTIRASKSKSDSSQVPASDLEDDAGESKEKASASLHSLPANHFPPLVSPSDISPGSVDDFESLIEKIEEELESSSGFKKQQSSNNEDTIKSERISPTTQGASSKPLGDPGGDKKLVDSSTLYEDALGSSTIPLDNRESLQTSSNEEGDSTETIESSPNTEHSNESNMSGHRDEL